MLRKTVVLLILFGLPIAATAAPKSYTVDPDHTFPYFGINHLGFSTIHGRFNTTEGMVTVDMENNSGAVDITIDAGSIDTAHEKRDDHLRSPDFLNAAEFPEITYVSDDVTIHDDGTATVNGELTILGVSKPVTLDVSHINCGVHPMNDKEVCGFNAETTIMRSDFGMTYALPGVGDEMKIMLGVEAYRE